MAVGKRVRGALYLHRSAIALLQSADAARAKALTEAVEFEWNVIRVSADGIALLLYANFDEDPFPVLAASLSKRDDGTGEVRRDYSLRSNPPVLHRKELLVQSTHPRWPEWSATTERLVLMGAFADAHRIGTRNAWAARLASLRITPTGQPA